VPIHPKIAGEPFAVSNLSLNDPLCRDGVLLRGDYRAQLQIKHIYNSIGEAFMKKLYLPVLFLSLALSTHATMFHYAVILDGATEFPSNNSPGMGVGAVTYDDAAHTLQLELVFSGLLGNTTASHIHAPTAIPFSVTNNAGVATTTPTFAGFPLGVTNGTYSRTLDLTLASSYNPAYVTANGGSTATAEVALATAIAQGRAYWNVHSSAFLPGEIRGFLVNDDEAPVIEAVTTDPSILWPPNRAMVPVTVSVQAVDDHALVSTQIIAVTSNESSNPGINGADWEITGPLTLNLRADRSGSGQGRIYTITVESVDDGGNSSTAEVTVSVPRGMAR
jgi:hypothetical protein